MICHVKAPFTPGIGTCTCCYLLSLQPQLYQHDLYPPTVLVVMCYLTVLECKMLLVGDCLWAPLACLIICRTPQQTCLLGFEGFDRVCCWELTKRPVLTVMFAAVLTGSSVSLASTSGNWQLSNRRLTCTPAPSLMWMEATSGAAGSG